MDKAVSQRGNVRYDRTKDVSAKAPSLGGDDLVMRLMHELHSHVPEDQRPMSMSDLSDEQAARARRAVHAVLVEWQSACAALRRKKEEKMADTAKERDVTLLRDKISNLITNELYERFGSPSAAVIGVKLADEILELPEVKDALRTRSTQEGDKG